MLIINEEDRHTNQIDIQRTKYSYLAIHFFQFKPLQHVSTSDTFILKCVI